MPRVVKPKVAAAGVVAKKSGRAKNKNKLYVMPEPIVNGTVLVDLSKTHWKVGPSIATGGFGEIYSACKVGDKHYDYVVKCEPHGNGPLFVEMHFYMRNARLEDIEQYKKERGIKNLGMPYMLGNGSHDINGQKHRFIVMPRYGSDISSFFLKNGRKLPEATIYRLALQMLDVYEYVHSCGYVHADLKSTNILLGYGKNGASQAYLVDYGLASHYTTKDFKPDPKKMHNGTIEYTSRDAHQGVATMRADLEILGYNLIEWSGAQLPWVRDNLLPIPAKVQQAKVAFMEDLKSNLKKLYPKGIPVPIAEFMKYVAGMKFNETPDYERCRKMFISALKTMKYPLTGDLDFQLKSTANNNIGSVIAGKHKTKASKKVPNPAVISSDEDEEIAASDDDDDDIFEQIKPPRIAAAATRKQKVVSKPISPPKRVADRHSPVKHVVSKHTKKLKTSSSPPMSPSPTKRKRLEVGPATPTQKNDHLHASHKFTKATHSDSPTPDSRSKPLSTSAIINCSPSVSVSLADKSLNNGKTVINDNMTPKPKAGKTYEFNFELDVSMDANVVVNVKRKRKPADASQRTTTRASPRTQTSDAGDDGSTVTRVKTRKLHSVSEKSSVHIKKPRK